MARGSFTGPNGVDGVRGRYVREMDAFEPTLIAGTENAVSPFFSPNGEWIGFFDLQASELRKVSLGGGAPTTVCGTERFPRGGTWGDDDTIFLNFGYYLGIHRVAASGGVPELLTVPNLDEGEKTHRFPEILPGGKALLFTVGTSRNDLLRPVPHRGFGSGNRHHRRTGGRWEYAALF